MTALVGLRPREPRRIACSISSKVQRRAHHYAALQTRLYGIVTGRGPDRNRSEISEQRAWQISAAPPQPAYAIASDPSVAPSGAGAGYGITTRQDGPLERGEFGFDDARARTPTGRGYSCGAAPSLSAATWLLISLR